MASVTSSLPPHAAVPTLSLPGLQEQSTPQQPPPEPPQQPSEQPPQQQPGASSRRKKRKKRPGKRQYSWLKEQEQETMNTTRLGLGPGRLAPPSPSPSVGSTTSAAAGAQTPRKGNGTPHIVYSQPALTGTGESVISQMAYAVRWLREKGDPQTPIDVLGYLSATARPESEQEYFVEQMRRNPHIQWIPDPALSEQTWRSGTYTHRPTIPNVKNKTQLLAYLQKKTDASGVSVKDLKDGWPDCDGAIAELEAEHKLLVIRAKKDGAAKMVWLDDPSLSHEIDPELKLMWSRIEVPSVENIVQRLVAAGQKPASEDPRLKAANAPKVEKKKRKVQRRGGKSTNTHMEHLLKDYSHMKR